MNENNPFIKPEQRDFYAETTRVWKGRIAPKGSIFFIVKYKDKKKSYASWILRPTDGMTDQIKEFIFNGLMEKLQKTYNV